jgi:hypothetical protein
LLINKSNDNAWIKIALTGTSSNRNGYGAKVRVFTKDGTQMREHTSAHGYNSTNDPVLMFGLGPTEMVDRIEISWPSGAMEVLNNVAGRQTLQILEPPI